MEGVEYVRVTGLLLWLVTDGIILWVAHRDQSYGMPFAATCLFLTYEIYTQFTCHAGVCDPNLFAPGAAWLLWIALVVNVLFYVQFVLYGFKNPIVPDEQRYFAVVILLGPLMAFFLHHTFMPSFPQVNGQLLDFWLMALIASANFVVLFFFRAKENFRGLSPWAARLKLVANFLIALSFVLPVSPTNQLKSFFYYLFFSVFIGDLGYVGLMQFRHKLDESKPPTASARTGAA